MGLIYLDTCILIYLVEDHYRYTSIARRAMEIADRNSDRMAFSALVELEALVVPLRRADKTLVANYNAVFRQLSRIELTDIVYRRAAALRAAHRLKTPDALHLACALHHGCTALWTNDTRLHGASGGIARALGELV
jgi:uncharacterized protein